MSEPNISDDADTNDARVVVWALQDLTEEIKYLAEQQRISNLIALASLDPRQSLRDQVATDAINTLTDSHVHNVGGWLQLKPEIAQALGVETNA